MFSITCKLGNPFNDIVIEIRFIGSQPIQRYMSMGNIYLSLTYSVKNGDIAAIQFLNRMPPCYYEALRDVVT